MAKGLDQIKVELVRAYQRGDKEALRAAIAEYGRGKAALEKSRANIASDVAAMGPDVSGNNWRAGAGRGLTKVAGQLLQLATPKSMERGLDSALLPVSDEARAEMERVTAPLMATRSGKVGNFIGEAAAAAPAGGLAGGLAKGMLARTGAALAPEGATAKALLELTKLPKYARYGGYAAEGAAGQAATTGEVTPGGALAGIVGGRGGEALSAGLGALVHGLKRTPGAERLLEFGADLTPGRLNPGGMLSRLEHVAEASPILGAGGMTQRARTRALEPVVPNLARDVAELPQQRGMLALNSMKDAADEVAAAQTARYGPNRELPRLTIPRRGPGVPPGPQGTDLEAFQDAMRASIRKHVPPKRGTVNAELRSAWERARRAGGSSDVKRIISDLRAKSRNLSKGGRGTAGSAQEARVYDDAANWLDDYFKRGATPERVARIEQADRVTRAYKPIERATGQGMAAGQDSPTGVQLLAALKRDMTPGQFTRGEGGQTRSVAEALVEQEDSRLTGMLERNPVARKALAALVAPLAVGAHSRMIRRMAQGVTPPQVAVQNLLDVPGVMQLLQGLGAVRRGVAGAASDELDEVQY